MIARQMKGQRTTAISNRSKRGSFVALSTRERSYWEVLKSGVGLSEMSDGDVLTKLSFFGRRPFRRIAKRNRKSVG